MKAHISVYKFFYRLAFPPWRSFDMIVYTPIGLKKRTCYKCRDDWHENTFMSSWRDKTVQKETKQIPGGQVNQWLLNTHQLAPSQELNNQLKAWSLEGEAGEAFTVSGCSRQEAGLGLAQCGFPYGPPSCHATTLHHIHFHSNYHALHASPGPLKHVGQEDTVRAYIYFSE